MREEEIIKRCFYYKGGVVVPRKYEHKKEHLLWNAEKYVCDEMFNKIDLKEPEKSIASFVAAYISKWEPFDYYEILDLYLSNIPTIKNEILAIYS